MKNRLISPLHSILENDHLFCPFLFCQLFTLEGKLFWTPFCLWHGAHKLASRALLLAFFRLNSRVNIAITGNFAQLCFPVAPCVTYHVVRITEANERWHKEYVQKRVNQPETEPNEEEHQRPRPWVDAYLPFQLVGDMRKSENPGDGIADYGAVVPDSWEVESGKFFIAAQVHEERNQFNPRDHKV